MTPRKPNCPSDPDSAVTGNGCSHALGSDVALNHANRKKTSPSCPPIPTINPVRISCHAPKNGNENRRSQENHSDAQRSERAFPGLVRTDFAAQRMTAENLPESKAGNVSQPRCENNVTDKGVGIARVRHESEMTEHPTDVNKTDNREGYALQLAVGAIAQNRNEQDRRDRERRRGDKEEPYQPGPCSSPRGSEISEAIPTVTIPA